MIGILAGYTVLLSIIWLFLKVSGMWDRFLRNPPESVVLRFLRKRNRPLSLFGEKGVEP